ncbi:MAG TPA: tetratricopeptide repeat protein [Gemmataceae bacterium]
MSQGQAPDASIADTPPPASAVVRGCRRRTVVLLLAMLVVAGGAVGATLAFRPRRVEPDSPRPARHLPPDPRSLYPGPLGNIRSDVAYIGDTACTPCHADIAASYRRHPMGCSLHPIEKAADREVYDAAHNNPFTALGARFRIERSGPLLLHDVTFADVPDQPPIRTELPVQFVIGSGSHGRSYLSSRDGFVVQTPISWFSQKHFWNLSPGFSEEMLNGRPVDAACLYCHANRANHREGTLNRFDEPIFTGHAIGCERCHGPGERHAETQEKTDIVNPKRLPTPKLRDAVCEQCHLEGEERVLRRGRGLYDFRPGLPLEDFWTVFVSAAEPGGEPRAVTHVEQMHESRCYLSGKSKDKKLLCISCHDPHVHVGPAERATYYRARCMNCHEDHPCSLAESARRKQQPDDSCIACHMPRFTAADIAHTAATDHRIVRFKSPPRDIPRHSSASPPLFPFHSDHLDADDVEMNRDLGIALARSMSKYKGRAQARGPDAAALLDAALRNDPEDIPALLAKGRVLMGQGRSEPALAAYRSVLRLAPEEESALVGAASLTQNMGRLEESLDYWRRAIAVNPEMAMYRMNLTRLLAFAKRWDEAREHCPDWIRLDPRNVEARKIWITCLIREGNKDAARAEFARIQALKPANFADLRIWFAQQMR